MTSEIYFPEPRLMLPLTVIRRERLLPDDVDGVVEVRANTSVSLRDVVARGTNPAPYVLIDALKFFRLRHPDQLTPLMQVEIGDALEVNQVIAQKGRRRLLSPIDGRLAYVGAGRVIIQSVPTIIELEAGVNGVVVEVKDGRGVVLETYGALFQGVWGNGRRAIGMLRSEPEGGIEQAALDAIDIGFRGALLVTRSPITQEMLASAAEQQLSGLIAPSMEADMIGAALSAPYAILLTEGFGSMRMSSAHFRFLDELDGLQATMDAVLPAPLEARCPELIIKVQLPNIGYRPPYPNLDRPLSVGMTVRLSREEMAGFVGEVIDLPKNPVLLDNGLRVRCAHVQLNTGEKRFVPLENLEVSG
jgi:hypothetical protein